MAKKQKTRAQAIDEFCRHCQGVPKGGDYSIIKECTASYNKKSGTYCPLYPFRIGGEARTKDLTDEERAVLSARAKRVFHKGGGE